MARPVGEVLGAPIEPHPQETAPAAPTLPVDAPKGSDGSEAGVGGSDGSAGLPGAPRGRGKPKRDRRAQRHPGAALIPAADKASRGRAWALILQDVAGGVTEPPLPMAVACRRRGIPLATVEQWLREGKAPDMEAARAEGLARCLRGALMGSGETARQWAWLAERLAPKELHLPTKVHTGQDPDAAPAASRVEVSLVDARDVARGVVTAALLPAKKDPTP